VGEIALTRLEGPAPEAEIAFDLVKRAAWVLPVAVILGAMGWGTEGMLSAAYAVAIVCLNFLLSAFLMSQSAKISLGLLMGAAMFGFLIRMGLILAAVWVVKDAWWLSPWPFGITLILTHLGLLFWEMKHISASLAFPGLKPEPVSPSAPLIDKESTPS
jgi:hypothetical protein